MRKKDIDPIDIQLINLLQQDANQTNATRSKEIGLSESNTWTRTQNLLKKGVLRIRALLNFMYFGYRYRCLVVVRLPKVHMPHLISILQADSCTLRVYLLKTTHDLASGHVSVLYESLSKTQNAFISRITEQFGNLTFYDQLDFDLFPVAEIVKDITYLEIKPGDVGLTL